MNSAGVIPRLDGNIESSERSSEPPRVVEERIARADRGEERGERAREGRAFARRLRFEGAEWIGELEDLA